ncbi:hypothetical protein SRABI27_00887 [Pedobacter sp. Bi27]|nr:hypothetical protein SRABI27_00887 [Pedobacter sp. Bi27]
MYSDKHGFLYLCASFLSVVKLFLLVPNGYLTTLRMPLGLRLNTLELQENTKRLNNFFVSSVRYSSHYFQLILNTTREVSTMLKILADIIIGFQLLY